MIPTLVSAFVVLAVSAVSISVFPFTSKCAPMILDRYRGAGTSRKMIYGKLVLNQLERFSARERKHLNTFESRRRSESMVPKPIVIADLVARTIAQWQCYNHVLEARSDACHHEMIICLCYR